MHTYTPRRLTWRPTRDKCLLSTKRGWRNRTLHISAFVRVQPLARHSVTALPVDTLPSRCDCNYQEPTRAL